MNNMIKEPRFWITLAAVGVVIWLAGIPVLMILWTSLTTGNIFELGRLSMENFQQAFADSEAYSLLWSSFVYATGTCFLSLFLGTSLAFIVERTDTPFKGFFRAFALVPLIMPGILHTISWMLLLSPRIGILNTSIVNLLGLQNPPFNLYSMGGMIWVEGLHLSPFVFIIMVAAFRSMDPTLEEAALASGAKYYQLIGRITLKLILPAILSAGLIIFIRGLESFEVPALIGLRGGVRVFTSRIWLALLEFPPNYGMASAFSVILIVISLAGIYFYYKMVSKWQKYATITGKNFRPHVLELGKWQYLTSVLLFFYFFILVGLPFLILLWTSLNPIYTSPSLDKLSRLTLDNYAFVFKMNRTQTAFTNSILLSLGSGVIVMMITAIIAWTSVKGRWWGRKIFDAISFLPITIPGIVLGLSLILVYLFLDVPIYGTLWILLLAYVTQYMPYGIRTNTSALVQIHHELEEAASVSGGNWLQTFRRITLPLMKPGLLAGFLYVVIVSFRELSSSILLYSSKSMVVSILIFDLWDGGQFTVVAALSVMMISFLVLVVLVANRLGSRFGIRIGPGE